MTTFKELTQLLDRVNTKWGLGSIDGLVLSVTDGKVYIGDDYYSVPVNPQKLMGVLKRLLRVSVPAPEERHEALWDLLKTAQI